VLPLATADDEDGSDDNDDRLRSVNTYQDVTSGIQRPLVGDMLHTAHTAQKQVQVMVTTDVHNAVAILQ
jgi:hypothetical protein